MDIKKLVEENLQFIFPLDSYHFNAHESDKKKFPSIILNERLHSHSISSILENEDTSKLFEFIIRIIRSTKT